MPSLPAGRLVGWLLIYCGVLLALGLLIRMGVGVYLWQQGAGSAADAALVKFLGFNALGLVAAGLLVRYGRRLLAGGRISDGPAGKTIL